MRGNFSARSIAIQGSWVPCSTSMGAESCFITPRMVNSVRLPAWLSSKKAAGAAGSQAGLKIDFTSSASTKSRFKYTLSRKYLMRNLVARKIPCVMSRPHAVFSLSIAVLSAAASAIRSSTSRLMATSSSTSRLPAELSRHSPLRLGSSAPADMHAMHPMLLPTSVTSSSAPTTSLQKSATCLAQTSPLYCIGGLSLQPYPSRQIE
mmetsp:Transcript_12050/g.25322  ORF Transcript_12050/g.25322 Transcript_12050/m.25322 type:complete len:206 (+) Transcript_12050:607-1224(+)